MDGRTAQQRGSTVGSEVLSLTVEDVLARTPTEGGGCAAGRIEPGECAAEETAELLARVLEGWGLADWFPPAEMLTWAVVREAQRERSTVVEVSLRRLPSTVRVEVAAAGADLTGVADAVGSSWTLHAEGRRAWFDLPVGS